MEKRTKYNDLVASAMILLTLVDMTHIILNLDPDEYVITSETLARLSPYLTDHYLRFGDFIIDLDTQMGIPQQTLAIPFVETELPAE